MTARERERRDALARCIAARLGDERRSFDELRVIDELLSRLERGADDYGPLVLVGDPRDWKVELTEELLDVAVYGAIRRLIARDEKTAAIEASDDFVERLHNEYCFANAGDYRCARCGEIIGEAPWQRCKRPG